MLHWALVASLLVLQFDGSFHEKARIGSCAAVFHDKLDRPIALGGRYLPRSSGCDSSGAAEYSGLIMGLNYLAENVEYLMGTTLHRSSTLQLLIQGDCRVVLDQMTGSSVPRILRRHNKLANVALESLNNACPHPVLVDWELIPRSRNSWPDAVAREALECIANARAHHIISLIEQHRLKEAFDCVVSRAYELPRGSEPAVLLDIIEAGRNLRDGQVMLDASQRMRHICTADSRLRALVSRAIQAEADALVLLSRDEAAQALEKKNRYILRNKSQKSRNKDAAASRICLKSSQAYSQNSWRPSKLDETALCGIGPSVLRDWRRGVKCASELLFSPHHPLSSDRGHWETPKPAQNT